MVLLYTQLEYYDYNRRYNNDPFCFGYPYVKYELKGYKCLQLRSENVFTLFTTMSSRSIPSGKHN